MRIQIFTREPSNEVPHVHVISGKGAGKAVVKVLLDGTLGVIQKRKRPAFPGKKLAMALDVIERHTQFFLDEWVLIHGNPESRR